MKKKTFLLAIAIIFLFTVYPFASAYGDGKEIKVLFIGNSLTSANKLPGMVADIAKSHGYKVSYDSHTQGGARLANHSSNARVLQKIKETSWDFVVFQEQSQYPGFSEKQLSKDVFPYAESLSEAVKENSGQSTVVFYMTMARRNGDPGNKNVSPELLTYEGMQKRVNWCYLEMGKTNGALVAPAGAVWAVVRQEKPTLNLYSDNVHPNTTGTYLVASVFYTTFFGKTSVGSFIPDRVDRTSAQYIQRIVDRIVLKQRQEWDWTK
jgi:hypothetical protein